MFHGVEGPCSNGSCKPLRPRLRCEDFERYIQVLSKCFNIISLQDAIEILSGRKAHEANSLVLTFDDAYRNNATTVWCILRRYGTPGTFFVPTGYIDSGRRFWSDRLDYAIQHLRAGVKFIKVAETKYPVTRTDRIAPRRLFWVVKAACGSLGQRNAAQVVAEIEEQATSRLADLSDNDHWSALMTWNQIRLMQQQGATFGSHTVHHSYLDELAANDIRTELAESKAEFERKIAVQCSAFAYPGGRFTPEVARMVRESGYRVGLTTEEKTASADDAITLLPRVGLPARSLSDADLLSRASGLSVVLSGFRRQFAPSGGVL